MHFNIVLWLHYGFSVTLKFEKLPFETKFITSNDNCSNLHTYADTTVIYSSKLCALAVLDVPYNIVRTIKVFWYDLIKKDLCGEAGGGS